MRMKIIQVQGYFIQDMILSSSTTQISNGNHNQKRKSRIYIKMDVQVDGLTGENNRQDPDQHVQFFYARSRFRAPLNGPANFQTI